MYKKLSFPLALILSGMICFSCEQKKESTSTEDGWTSLFDGESLEGWKALGGEAEFIIEDDAIVGISKVNTPNTFLSTEKIFGDYILELDLKIEDETSNSGVMTRGQYDAQKGRVFGYQVEADPKERAWSGGIYDEARRGWLYPLSLNPEARKAFKLGEYNHYRIEAIGNEIKTWINGQPVAYLVDDMDSQGFIGLQVHSIGSNPDHAGRKTYFKNIKVQTENLEPKAFEKGHYVVSTIDNSLTDYEKEDGWKLLFNGTNTAGWKSAKGEEFPSKGWTVSEGVLTIAESDGSESQSFGDIITEDMYSAFDLSFQFKLSEGANSGVKYFVTLDEKTSGSAIGLEYQILDDEKHPDAKKGKNGNRTLSSLYDLITADKQPRFIKPIGEWNQGRVVVYPNNHVEHYLNGVKVLEYERGSDEYRKLVAGSKYAKWEDFGEADQGHILLQDHGNLVSFKSIKLKPLH
ncbi:3-keto-disaccharide hydrolase [Echinicola vietnamensis]|uniref:3-keto-alpha-glucoside-1,2-lyase/3-keto-2-hydroxy-glucal hydratase domain-containing protein n=1 Tax=Echinicola vietnamensis (strain DSM 17526 / LMG 23754 / KMM 6221) TaxID=926556 RepID=L0G3F0_ECHVK|nr:DUF1080 domain-containing protein [Echinicola vietnamensis]AGA79848.1 protein of unknown function (DUF1080) [Echinicola vietnamensis DSM 17526]